MTTAQAKKLRIGDKVLYQFNCVSNTKHGIVTATYPAGYDVLWLSGGTGREETQFVGFDRSNLIRRDHLAELIRDMEGAHNDGP